MTALSRHLDTCEMDRADPGLPCTCYAEAIVRGHKSGLLTVPDYNNLTQCEALDDIKLNLVSINADAAPSADAQISWQHPCTAV